MKKVRSYRDSHTGEGKGAVYDEHYTTMPRRKIFWDQEQRVLSSFLDTYLKNRTVNLLDFACGTGRITSFLENRVATSTAVDVSSPMLDEARKKLKRTKIIQADLTKNNVLKGRKFNLITAFRFFLNAELELRTEALQVLVSLLSKDGYIVFNNHKNRTSPLVWSKYFYHSKIRRSNVQFMSIHEIKKLTREADLEIIRIYPVGLLSLPKVKPPGKLSHSIDSMAMKFRLSGILSESPIVVCRRRQEIHKNRLYRKKNGRIRFTGSIVRKSVPPGSLRIELEKTRLSRLIGEQTGLFYVPRVIQFNEKESTIDFEYLEGLRTIQEVAISNSSQLINIFTRIGAALAAIHDNLVLRPDMKKNLPSEWMCSDENNVFLHGDFTAHNICFHKASNRIVILDWSTADFLGGQHTYGSRYFDITWFIYFMFHYLPARYIVRWDSKGMADAFIEGYTGRGQARLESSAFRHFHLKTEKLKRKKFWSGGKNYPWYRRMGYLGLCFWKWYRYHCYEPRSLAKQS